MNYKEMWKRLKYTAETFDLVDMDRADFLKSLIKMIETAEGQDRPIESITEPIKPINPYVTYYKTSSTCETKEGTGL